MNLFPAFQPRSVEEPDENIGTPEAPIDLSLASHPRIPTGANAQRSVSARWKAFAAGDQKDDEAFFPVNARAARRADQRAAESQRRKHQRGYYRRELAKENAARDLALAEERKMDAATGHPVVG